MSESLEVSFVGESLLPTHLFEQRRKQEQLLNEDYHDKALPKLQESKNALKIGADT